MVPTPVNLYSIGERDKQKVNGQIIKTISNCDKYLINAARSECGK